MSQDSSPEREFERLSKAITEAVMTSAKVRKIVSEIQKKDEVCAQSFMVLVLKLSTLTESVETDTSEDIIEAEAETEVETETESSVEEKPKKKTVRKSRKKPEEERQFIDGEALSKKEVEFQEFINNQFDQGDWLKKNKLIL